MPSLARWQTGCKSPVTSCIVSEKRSPQSERDDGSLGTTRTIVGSGDVLCRKLPCESFKLWGGGGAGRSRQALKELLLFLPNSHISFCSYLTAMLCRLYIPSTNAKCCVADGLESCPGLKRKTRVKKLCGALQSLYWNTLRFITSHSQVQTSSAPRRR